jgi:hypothetical protein
MPEYQVQSAFWGVKFNVDYPQNKELTCREAKELSGDFSGEVAVFMVHRDPITKEISGTDIVALYSYGKTLYENNS